MDPDPSQPQLTIMRPALSQSPFLLAQTAAQEHSAWQEFQLRAALMQSVVSQPQSLLTGIPLPLTTYYTLTAEL
jgi:hypothetical protein